MAKRKKVNSAATTSAPRTHRSNGAADGVQPDRSGAGPARREQGNDGKKTVRPRGRGAWKLLDRGSTLVAGLLSRQISIIVWRAATGRKPPAAGRNPEVAASEAVAWAAVGGALVEVVRLLIRRWAVTYWVRSTGALPPGMKSIAADEAAFLTGETTEQQKDSKKAINKAKKRAKKRIA